MSEQEKREFIITAHDDVFEKWLLETGKQELIRCKDCWRKGNPFECRLASDVQEHGGSITEEYDDWFCADGEREEQK